MQLAEHDFPAVILAGGQGRRIGGDKAWVLLGGVPLWRHVLDRVSPQVHGVAVNADAAFEGLPVVADEVPGQGPLGGILAAMVWAHGLGAARLLTVAVDTPFLPLDLVARLDVPGRIVAAKTADGLHGTTALWDVSLADDLRNALAAGTRKVTDWADGVGVTPVMFEDAGAFFNVNTAEDLAMAEARL
ncbi:molybdenum cofactor guanylyltransferase [Jannaschia sp. EhC01]|nr:molybdenum cofactor guanylyltransferase [Jannaschia sp. EhC01]